MMISGRPPFRVLARILAVVPVLAGVTVVGAATKVGPAVSDCAQAATVHHAALVVEHSDGVVIKVCVSFTADSITGDQVLALSGVRYATADYGGTGKAVCQIDGEPAQYPPGCWTASSPYWAMFVSRAGGSWLVSSLGISSQTFRDGDAEGFRYESQSDSPPPPSPRGVCPPPASPTPAPVGTPTPVPSRRSTAAAGSLSSQPSHTPTPTPTPTTSPTVTQLAIIAPSGSATTPAAAGSPRRNPPSRPGAFTTGAWAASGLAFALLVMLAVQVIRPRRRRSPPRWQP